MIPKTHPLAAVNDVFNTVFVEGDAVGELMFYGRGAGKLPTAAQLWPTSWRRAKTSGGRDGMA